MTDTTPWQGRVLLADDIKTNQLIIKLLLNKIGIELDVVNNSDDTLQALATVKYDLMFINSQLAPVNGYDLSRQIRAQGNELIIVALTTNAMMDEMLQCAEAGMSDVLAVPLSTQDVLYCLERWEPQSGLHKQINPDNEAAGIAQTVPVSQVIQREVLEKLQTDLGAEFNRVFKNALQTLNEQMDYVRTHIPDLEQHCDEDLTRHIHSFKSTSATLGGQDLSRLAQKLEDYSKLNNVAALQQNLVMLEEKYQQLSTALHEWQ